jgi:hypothetical protein
MTIFQAEAYDPRKARRRNIIILTAVVVVIVLAALAFLYRNWPEERVAAKFFTALQNKDYKAAYGYWIADPGWEEKPPLQRYPFSEFYNQWGPGGDWGVIRSFHVDGSAVPKDSSGSSNGVVVFVTVNDRKQQVSLFVDRKDHSITDSPFQVVK